MSVCFTLADESTFLLLARSGAPYLKENAGNPSMAENLVMTSAYETLRMDSGRRVKKLSRVGKGVPNIYFDFPFGAKLSLWENQRNCWGKILMEISCVRKFRKQFSWLYFLLCTFSVSFWSQSMDNPSPNPRLVKFWQVNSCVKTRAASELVDRLVAVVLIFISAKFQNYRVLVRPPQN